MITFYDIAAQPLFTTFSPNPWKTRYLLNFKGLPYKSVRIEFPDIANVSESAGIPPYWTKPDGVTPLYTCPAITDDTTGAALPDSYKIAEYLDKNYPDTPKAIPPGTEAFHAAFYAQFTQLIAPVVPLLVSKIPSILNPRGVEYYIPRCSEIFRKPFSEIEPVGEAYVETWAKVKANLGEVDRWLSKSSGPFFMGEVPAFADFVIAAALRGIKEVFGEDNKEWRDIQGWHNGRWKKLLESLKQYEGID